MACIWALPLATGFAAYDNRMADFNSAQVISTTLALWLLAFYFCTCIGLVSVYWFMDRWGAIPALRHFAFDGIIISAPLIVATSSIIQENLSAYTDGVIIAGTFAAMGIVVVINIFRGSIR